MWYFDWLRFVLAGHTAIITGSSLVPVRGVMLKHVEVVFKPGSRKKKIELH